MTVAISDSQLKNNTCGLHLEECVSNCTVRSVTCEGNRRSGIHWYNSDGHLNVTELIVAGTRKYGIEFVKSECYPHSSSFSTQLNVDNSEFRDNPRYGVKFYTKCGVKSVISNSHFHSNHRAISSWNYNSNDNIVIERCTFVNQTEISVTVDTWGAATIYNNSFANNRNVCIDVENVQKTMSLERNMFTGNSIENPLPLYVLELSTISATVILRSKISMTLRYNVFKNPDIQFQLATTVEDAEYTIDARYNYWGSADINDVMNSLLGYPRHRRLAKILYHPYLESEDDDSYNATSRRYPDVVQGHDIGGIVTDEVELYDTHTPYRVAMDIIVHATGSLLISAGVTLEFESGRGIIVMGTLQVQGSSSNEVVMSAKRQTRHPRMRLLNEEEDGRTVSGIVQIYSFGAWRSVCYGSFYKHKATLVFMCRATGFVGYDDYDSVKNESLSLSSLSTFQCRSGRFSECEFPADGVASCSGDDVLEVTCVRNFWTGIHLAIDARPSVIRNARMYQTNGRQSYAPSCAAIQVDFLHNHVIANVHIADLFYHDDSRGLVVSRVGVSSDPVSAVTVVMSKGIAIESLDSRIVLQDLNVTSTQNSHGTGVHVKPKHPSTAVLRKELTVLFTSVTSVHVTVTESLFLNVGDSLLNSYHNDYYYFRVTTSEGNRLAADVIRGTFSSTCSASTLAFHDGLRNESAAASLTAGPHGELFRTSGAVFEVGVRRPDYYSCMDVVWHVYVYRGTS